MCARFSKIKNTKHEHDEAYAELDELYQLPDDVLHEVIREGEVKLATQFAIHSSSEQRGFGLASLSLTFSAASFAAVVNQHGTAVPDKLISTLATIGSVGFLIAGVIAIVSIWPGPRHTPGNHPKNWLPSKWKVPKGKNLSKWAAVEQAKVLQRQIDDNLPKAKRRAVMQRVSILLAFVIAFLCGGYYLI